MQVVNSALLHYNSTVRGVHIPSFFLFNHNAKLCVASNPRASPLERSAKSVQPKRSQQAQSNGQRLARLDGAGNRAAGQNNRSKKSKLDAIWVAVLDAQAAENVQ